MDWTPAQIIAKADGLIARGPGRITLAVDTLHLIATALRTHAHMLSTPRHDLFVVESWCGDPDVRGETIASVSRFDVARAAYEIVCGAQPNHRVTLRQGGRVVSLRDGGRVRF